MVTGQTESWDRVCRHGEAVNNPEVELPRKRAGGAGVTGIERERAGTRESQPGHCREDWKYAVEGLKMASPLPEVYGAPDDLERISFGVVASVELFEATGDRTVRR